MHRLIVVAIACSFAVRVGAQARLTDRQISEAIALGGSCGEIPLMKVDAPEGDFVVFIEGPFARLAEHAAVARQMNVPFNASRVTPDMIAPDYRIWVQYNLNARREVRVNQAVLRPVGATKPLAVIHPIRESVRPQLTLGPIPAHGIITEVRWRWHEWIFDRLPPNDFHVVLNTSAGQERHTVTNAVRTRPMRVCT